VWVYLRNVEARCLERVQLSRTTRGGFTAKHLQFDCGKQLRVEATSCWTLDILRAIFFLRLMAESVLLLSLISTENHSHLQRATNIKKTRAACYMGFQLQKVICFVRISVFFKYTM